MDMDQAVFLSICWSTRMATPEIPCCEIPVLLIFCFCKTANPEMPCGEVPVLLNFQFLQNQQIQRCHVVNSSFVKFPVFVESANPEMPCGEVPVLIIYSHLNNLKVAKKVTSTPRRPAVLNYT